MAETTEIIKVSENANETDPKVVFDPKFEKSVVAKLWAPQDENAKTTETTDDTSAPKEEATRIDAIYVPLIKINSIVIPNDKIQYMKFDYTGFKPTIELQIIKFNFSKLETPGMANKITVIMIPPVDKTYRKISVDFYIESVDDIGNLLLYSGIMFFPALEKKNTRSIRLNGNNKLTTYEFCESIAAECQLGFAATKQCKEIADTKTRLLRSQTLQQGIIEHTNFGGIDNNSFFVSWIDVYGYLVLSNISWVLGKATKADELSIHMLEGLNLIDSTAFEQNNIKFGENTFRSYTNWRMMSKQTSNQIEKYEWIINNYSIKSHGTNNTYYTINHKVTGGSNNINVENITIQDDSADGLNFKNEYDFQNIKFLGTELASSEDGNTPVLYQKQRRDAYITKLKAKRLKVSLLEMNIGLERGTLINIMIFEYERDLKIQMLNYIKNLQEKGNTEIYTEENIDKEILDNPNIGVPNLSISGIYYIDGIEYEYKKGTGKIKQTLYLIKQTPSNNYINMSSLPKLKPNMS